MWVETNEKQSSFIAFGPIQIFFHIVKVLFFPNKPT